MSTSLRGPFLPSLQPRFHSKPRPSQLFKHVSRPPRCRRHAFTTPEAVAVGGDGLALEALNKAANIIANIDKLIPYDSDSANMGLIVWQAIRDIPESQRPDLIARLSSGDIRRLWKAAGKRYGASRGALVAALGPEYSLWKDMPSSAGEIVYFEGKAALPVHTLGISKFSKVFFLGRAISTGSREAENEEEEEEDQLFGRVIHPTAIGNRVYPGPMYFRARIESTVAPLTQELCDMTLSYPADLGLDLETIPRSSWPQPRRPRRPFDCGYVDYVRAAGPGVLVGMGYRTEADGSGVPLVPSPLHFVMARSKLESLR